AAELETCDQAVVRQHFNVVGCDFCDAPPLGLNRDDMGQPHDPDISLVGSAFKMAALKDVEQLRMERSPVKHKFQIGHTLYCFFTEFHVSTSAYAPSPSQPGNMRGGVIKKLGVLPVPFLRVRAAAA